MPKADEERGQNAVKKKLMLSNAVIVVLGFAAAFVTAAFLIQAQYRGEFSKRLDAVLALLAAQEQQMEQNPQGVAKRAGEQLALLGQPVRITIMDLTGEVLGDSAQNADFDDNTILENHLDRPEIQQALQKGRGSDTRTSASTQKSYYYDAILWENRILIRAAMPTEDLDSTIWRLWAAVLSSMALGIALVCLITWFLVQKAAKPVFRLTRAARSLAAGNYQSRVEGRFEDEYAELARAFNTMAASTQEAVEALRRKQNELEGVLQAMDDGVLAVDGEQRLLFLNQSARRLLGAPDLCAGAVLEGSLLLYRIAQLLAQAAKDGKSCREELSEDVQERRFAVYAAPIEGQNAALAVVADVTHVRALERMRSEFVANVTHELKTPLTSIQGSIELLKSAGRDERTRACFYDILDVETQRLRRLIDDMLTLSQIEGGREDPDTRPCRIQDVLQETAQLLRPLAEPESIRILLDVDPNLTIQGSPERLRQLFRNLMENAVKYNNPNGQVTVTAKKQRGTAVIRVSDTGIGIAPEHLPRLFERFYRADTSRSRQVGGTGLGLSIAKHLAALYGGTIQVESALSKGSNFTVYLPVK